MRGWLMASCPFAKWKHTSGRDRNPSFGVSINDKGLSGYNCFSCGQTGRISGLVRALSHFREVDYGDLAIRAEMAESAVPEFEEIGKRLWDEKPNNPINPAIVEGFYRPVWEVPEYREYVEGRGVTERTAECVGLLADEEKQRVLFPVYDRQKNLYGFTGRLIYEDEDRPKIKDYYGLSKESNLLGAEFLHESEEVLLVEGLFAYTH